MENSALLNFQDSPWTKSMRWKYEILEEYLPLHFLCGLSWLVSYHQFRNHSDTRDIQSEVSEALRMTNWHGTSTLSLRMIYFQFFAEFCIITPELRLWATLYTSTQLFLLVNKTLVYYKYFVISMELRWTLELTVLNFNSLVWIFCICVWASHVCPLPQVC